MLTNEQNDHCALPWNGCDDAVDTGTAGTGLSRPMALFGTAVGIASLMAGAAAAQESGVALPTIDVTGNQESPDNTVQADTGVSRLGRVQDIPQTVNVINQQTLQQQNVTTLDQALRNVPGVTVAIGEGGGGMNGDQFRIRGFQAKGDIYTDGLRDFGVYVRDAFAYDQVQVIKGPASESFGMGTTGGAINNVLKKAKPVDFIDVQGTLGNGPMARAVADVNRKISDTSAIRIVAMGHKQDIVDRDHMFSDRAGLFAAAAFGIGTATTFDFNYLYQHGERQPDMGEPIVVPAGAAARSGAGKPASTWGTPRSNHYGKETDADRHNVHMLTARFKSEVTDWLTVTNDSRLAFYNRYWAQTVVSCTGACATGVTSGNFNVAYGFGGPAGFVQDSWGLQNITTAIAKFHTMGLRHELVAGIDVFHQGDKRTQLANSVANGAKNAGTMQDPIFQSNYTVAENGLALKDGSSTGFGAFASDRIWLTEQFSVLGGIRWDNYHATYKSTNTTTGAWDPELVANDSYFSPKASAIWEPTKAQTYYVSWSRSYSNLAGQFISNENNGVSNTTLEPEKNDLWEVGAKLSFLDGRLGATAALFQVKKNNSVQTDPATGDVVPTNETQRVRGLELGLTGKITDAWTVQIAYAYMQSKILGGEERGIVSIGNEVPYVANNTLSLWTTYNVAPLMQIPGTLLVGGGFVYTDDFYTDSPNTSIIPSSFVVNAMISYEYKNYRIALNGYNITNELYYDTTYRNRAVVAAGPTVMLTGGIRW